MNPWGLAQWLGLLLIVVVYGFAWYEVAPPEADLPPCHFIVVLLFLSIATFFAWREDRRIRRERNSQDKDQSTQ